DTKEDYRRRRDAKLNALETKRADLEGMRDEMQRMQQVEDKKKHLGQYRTKLLGVEINSLTDIQNEKQQVVADATEQLRSERRKIEPLEVKERALRRQQASRDKAVSDARQKHKLVNQSLSGKAAQQQALEEQVEDLSEKLQLLDQERAKKERRRDELGKNVQAEERQLEAMQAELPQVEEDMRHNKGGQDACRERAANLKDEENELMDKRNSVKALGNSLLQQKENLQDFKQIYRDSLARGNEDRRQALAAHNWLRQYEVDLKRSGQLKSDVEDPALRVMVEHSIPNAKLLGFVVDNDA
ncbi:hypothetical protein B484DRAFT_402865, partial [Ochromonadaceae sp. CCMP2298]